jgi:hypothetical protein
MLTPLDLTYCDKVADEGTRALRSSLTTSLDHVSPPSPYMFQHPSVEEKGWGWVGGWSGRTLVLTSASSCARDISAPAFPNNVLE